MSFGCWTGLARQLFCLAWFGELFGHGCVEFRERMEAGAHVGGAIG